MRILTLLGIATGATAVLRDATPFVCSADATSLDWHTAGPNTTGNPLGRGFSSNLSHPYNRLPAEAEGTVRSVIWGESTMPAGLFLQFKTDASCVVVRHTLLSASLAMWHFPSTGVAGMDLYGWDEGNATWRWTGTTVPTHPTTIARLASLPCNGPCPLRAYRLHLPTYAAIGDTIELGLSPGANLVADSSALSGGKPVLWYGSSILQGGVASRPGHINTHIVARNLGREVYNFGFSGNCLMEISVAQYLVQVPDIGMFIIDCNPNMDAELIGERTIPLIRYIRQNGHPTTPIVLTEGTPYGTDWSLTGNITTGNVPKNQVLRAQYEALLKDPVVTTGPLFYTRTEELLADPLGMEEVNPVTVDPTVGGTHLTDLGMWKQAAFWSAAIPKFEAEAARQGPATTAQQTPAQSGRPRLQTPAEFAAEAARSEAHRAQMTPIDPLDPLQRVEAAAMPTSTRATGAQDDQPFVDAAEFLRGQPVPLETRSSPYNRLPDAAAASIPSDLWELSEMSSGEYLRFTTDSHHVAFKWTLRAVCGDKWAQGCHLFNMPDSATSAFDTYVYDPTNSSWRHFPNDGLHYAESGSVTIVQPEKLAGRNVTYLIYLPLRNAPADLGIQVDAGTTLCGAGCPADTAPQFKTPAIVWYGSAIQQGGATARAGTAYDAVIARTISHEIYNLGFASSGGMELGVAGLIAKMDPAVIVIDCLSDMNASEVTTKTAPLVHYLRANGHPTTPIVLAEGTPTPGDWLASSISGDWSNPKNAALRSAYDGLKAAGDTHLVYVASEEFFQFKPAPLDNPTVCGVQPADLGQYQIAAYYSALLPSLLAVTN